MTETNEIKTVTSPIIQHITERVEAFQLSRREFIEITAAVAAVAGLSAAIPQAGSALLDITTGTASTPASSTIEDVWVPTLCLNCGAHAHCGLLVHRVNGTVTRVKGNPAFPNNAGRLCAKPQEMVSELYNPYRVKSPMKRTNPNKGANVDPGWVEITWDEAIGAVAAQLKSVIADSPAKLVLMGGHIGPNLFTSSFASALGGATTVMGGTATFCGGGSNAFDTWIYGAAHTYPEMSRTKYVINLGGNIIQGAKGTPPQILDFITGRENGLQVVNVAPNVAPSTAKSGRWVPLVPGMAIPFLAAMTDVMVNELNAWDAPYLTDHTNATYLIGPDGHYVRAAGPPQKDPVRGQQLGPPLVWDTSDSTAKPFNDPSLKSPALTGTYTANGVTAKTGLQMLKEWAAGYTPEMTEPQTGIPAAMVRQIADEFVQNACIGQTTMVDGLTLPYRPVGIFVGSGGKGHIDNHQTIQACTIPCILVGAVSVAGSPNPADWPNTMSTNPVDGMGMPSYHYTPVPAESKKVTLADLFPLGAMPGIFWDVIVNPSKYNFDPSLLPTVFGMEGGNPQQLGPGPDIIDQAFAKFKFVFAISLVFDEPTQEADIVLPENSWLERTGTEAVTPYRGYDNEAYNVMGLGTALRQPTVKSPVFNTREGDDIIIALAQAAGIDQGTGGLYDQINKQYKLPAEYQLSLQAASASWPDIVDRILKAGNGPDKGLTWFSQNGLSLSKHMGPADFYEYVRYPNLRVPIYVEELVGWREELATELPKVTNKYAWSDDYILGSFTPLPECRPHPEHLADPKTYPFYAINWKNMQLFYGNNDVPWTIELTELMDPYSMHVLVNPADAGALGLSDGDTVELTSMAGNSTQGPIKVSNLVMPGVLGIPGSYGDRSTDIHPWARTGPNFNTLWELDWKYFDPQAAAIDLTTKVSLKKVSSS